MIFKSKNNYRNSEKNKVKKMKKKVRFPNTSQKTIPIINAYDDGIIESKEGEYSKTLEFLDINYHSVRDDDREDIFAKYCEFLNFFNSSVNLQITINNKFINQEEFKKKVILKNKEDDLLEYREEYNEMLKKLSSILENVPKKF